MKNEITYFSMFTGVGGFEYGFERHNYLESQPSKGRPQERRNWATDEQGSLFHAGSKPSLCRQKFRCVGCSENDKFASRVLRYRFPEIPNYGDITKVSNDDIERIPDFDLLCGGFPCQAFSIAGKRRGFNDTRGTLFFEIARVLKVKEPPVVLLENVKGLLSHGKGATFRIILQTLAELGYDVQWVVLNSKFFGVPQNRERVFIIGSLRAVPRRQILPFPRENKEVVEAVFEEIQG